MYRWCRCTRTIVRPARTKARSSGTSNLVGVDQVTGSERVQYVVETLLGQRKAAVAASDDAVVAGHLGAHIPGRMHDDRSGLGVAVAGFKAAEPKRAPVGTDIGAACQVGALGCGVRVQLIREVLQPSRMRRIRAPSVRHQISGDACLLYTSPSPRDR